MQFYLAAEPVLVPIDRSDPWRWAGYLAVIVAVHLIARLTTWLTIWLTAWPSRRAQGKHWSEIARLTYPARLLGARCIVLVVLPLVFVGGRDGRRIELLPSVATFCLLFIAAWTGVVSARIALEPRFNPAASVTSRPQLAAWISNWLLRGIPVLIGFALYAIVPRDGGPIAWAILLLGVLALGAYFSLGWLPLMRATGLVRPAGERFRSIVSEIADRMNARPKAVIEIGLPMANALAYPLSRSLGITEAALAVLADGEVAAVTAHEIGHLSEPRRVTVVRSTGPLVAAILVAAPAAVGPVVNSAGMAGFLVLLLSPFALVRWSVWFRNVYRKMEERADSLGRQFEPAAGAYGRALEKLHATNMMPFVLASRSRKGKQSKAKLYPELYDRLESSGVTPDFPRPEAPSELQSQLGLVTLLAFVAAGCYAVDQLALAVSNW